MRPLLSSALGQRTQGKRRRVSGGKTRGQRSQRQRCAGNWIDICACKDASASSLPLAYQGKGHCFLRIYTIITLFTGGLLQV
jgi:hypothetical protein